MATLTRSWPLQGGGGMGGSEQRWGSVGGGGGSLTATEVSEDQRQQQQLQSNMDNAVDRFLSAPPGGYGSRTPMTAPAAAMAAAAAARETALAAVSASASFSSSSSTATRMGALAPSLGGSGRPSATAATAAGGSAAPQGDSTKTLIQQELPEEIDPETVQRLLEQADEIHVEAITAANMKRCVAQLEKRIKKNQQDRIRHADDPEKWVKSEVDLDEEIKRWKPLAADPELYSLFISSRGLEFLLSLLNHSNVDIQLEVLDVFAEFTDADAVAECEEPQAVVDSLVEHQLLELTVEALLRINEEGSLLKINPNMTWVLEALVLCAHHQEAGEDEHRGVAHCLSIIENLLELQPSLATRLARLQKFPNWLLRRVRHPLASAAAAAAAASSSGAAAATASVLYDYNRVYASELLVILLQNSATARETLGAKHSGDALDKLLRAVAVYRKRDPESSQEEEMVQNLFDALCSLLLAKPNQELLGRQQGIELMLRIVKERRFFCSQALKVLDFALLRCESNCQLFVEKLGLKFLFSIFMKKAPAALQQKKRRKRSKAQEKQDEEHAVSIINSLCRSCSGIATARLLNKFMENQCEKIERLLELHDAYSPRVQTYLARKEKGQQEEQQRQQSDGPAEGSVHDLVKRVTKELEIDEEEQKYLDACDRGLFTLQQIDCIIIRLTSMGNALVTKRLIDLINMKSIEVKQIKQVVADYVAHMDASAEDEKKTLTELMERFEAIHAADGIMEPPEDEDEDDMEGDDGEE